MSEVFGGSNGEKRKDEPTPTQHAEAYLQSQASPAWPFGVTSDFINVAAGMAARCEAQPLWSGIKPVPSIEEYVRQKISGSEWADPEAVANAVIARLNPVFLKRANEIIAQMNEEIGSGVTKQEQATMLEAKFERFNKLVREGVM